MIPFLQSIHGTGNYLGNAAFLVRSWVCIAGARLISRSVCGAGIRMMGGWFSQPPIYKAVPSGIFEKGLSLHDHNVRRMNRWVAAIKFNGPSTVV